MAAETYGAPNREVNMRDNILVVEDDRMLLRYLRRGLEQQGYRVATASSIRDARELTSEMDPSIVLLDLMLPDGDGRDLCRQLRAASDRVIVVISARREVAERVHLLDVGADDYLVKPFDFTELTAHLRALRRRLEGSAQRELVCGDLVVDVDRRIARRGDRILQLTETQFSLLTLLIRYVGQALDEATIANRLWGDAEAAATSNRVEVHAYRLRAKLHELGEPLMLFTQRTSERGASYVLRAPK